MSGQVPPQPGTQLPLVSQQNGLPSPRIEKSNPYIITPRAHMQSRLYDMLMRRRPETPEMVPVRIHDIARRLDDSLYKFATSQEEYMNYDTLERRILPLLRKPDSNNNTTKQ